MINDLSLLLRNVLDDASLPDPLRSAQKRFDRPTDPYSVDQDTVNLFLYDIRENMELRSNEPIIERSNRQATIHRPPLRVSCSYLVTAWIPGAPGEALVLQEQLLLSQVLQSFFRFPTIPASFLAGTGLAGQEPPLPMVTAQSDGLKSPSEFWTAVGNKLRPSVTVTVTISMDLFPPETAPLAITQQVDMEQMDRPATREEMFRIGGRVTDNANAPVEGATVLIVERGLTATTDADGRYNLGLIQAGNYTLRAQTPSATRDVAITVPAPAGSDYNVQLI